MWGDEVVKRDEITIPPGQAGVEYLEMLRDVVDNPSEYMPCGPRNDAMRSKEIMDSVKRPFFSRYVPQPLPKSKYPHMTEMFEGLCPACKAVMVEWQKLTQAECMERLKAIADSITKDKPPVL